VRGLGPLPPGVHKGTQQFTGGACERVNRRVELRKLPRDVLPYHGFEEFFFAGEVQKQRPLGNPSQARDFFGFGGGKALFHKQG
jgi:hypothetical protein